MAKTQEAQTQAHSISDRAKQAAGLPAVVSDLTPEQRAELARMDDEDAGQGVSTAMDDNIVPLVRLLHYTAPQVDRRDPAYIEGAEPGDIWVKGAPAGMEIVRGGTGILFQPCYYHRDVFEWVPRDSGGGGGKGLVAIHNYREEKEVPGARQDSKDKWHWTTADGTHDLVGTRHCAGYLYLVNGLKLPFIVSVSGSRIQFMKDWVSLMNTKLVTEGKNRGQPKAAHTHLYRITSEPRSNDDGKWFTYRAQVEREVSPDERLAGREIFKRFKVGELVGEVPTDEGEKGASASTPSRERVDATV